MSIQSVRSLLNTKKIKKGMQRSTLFLVALLITFAALQPVQVLAFGGLFDQKPQSKKQSVLPATKVSTLASQAIADTTTGTPMSPKKEDRTIAYEDIAKRTANTSTFVNRDGTKTLRYTPEQQNYKQGSSWQKIDNTLRAIEKPVSKQGRLNAIINKDAKPEAPSEFTGKAGIVATQMKPLAEGLKIDAAGKSITIKPLGAGNVKPERKDDRTVVYKNAWQDVDLEYELRGEMVKEIIVVKSKRAQTTFDFNVSGGKIIPHPARAGELTLEGLPAEFSFSSLSLDVNGRGVISEQHVTQGATASGIAVTLDKKWMQEQPAASFPMRIDPSFGKQGEISYQMFKSDGYACGANICYANIGTLDDRGWKHWRTYFHFPYWELSGGKKVVNANLHGWFKHGINGIGDGRWISMGHAPCISFHCTGTWSGQAHVGTDFDINFTDELRASVERGDFGAWWSLWGEEGPYKSYKPYYDLRADIVYDTPTPVATPIEPADKQVTINTQPTLRVNGVGDADGDAVRYYYRVSTSPDAETGAVINSGWTPATQWTVPDGILQDGTTYYWHTYTMGATQTNPNWVRSFKVDLRTGKDSTQAYDTVGPIGIDLATGNATTSTGTHTMNALGGSIGLNFDYNTPTKSKQGLTGEYWNLPAGYGFGNGAPSGAPGMTRNDLDINFDWPNGSGPGGSIGTDWFYGRWKGYFVAPTTGSYYFGGIQDDAVSINVNGQYFAGCPGGTPCYYGAPITLQAGQAVPITVDYEEATGNGYFRMYVKGAVPEQIVPRDWLRTEVQPSAAQYGLLGRYYTDDGSHNFPANNSDPMRFMMARNDPKLSFEWGMGGPASGLQADNFMTRWTGYITVPVTGTYTFGAHTDDGVRIKLNNGFLGAQQTVLDAWQDQAVVVWGGGTNLTAGQQVPITVDYFEHGGGARFNLLVRGPNLPDQEIPVKWLTPKASALPDAWRLGVDVDGDVGYERLRVAGQNIVLEDSTRATHEYTWTGSGYKPPVNEDGQLSRNANNTYTLLDTDGRTYIFDAEGKLISLTTPSDDRKPANLKYEYAGDPSRLMKIVDGVTSSRYGTLHYRGMNEDNHCAVPSGFDPAPDGMLCAFKTSDGDITKLYYKAGQLSRVEKPGSDLIDFGYDSLGRISSTRDSIANDAIAANVRPDDTSATTEVAYDHLGRANGVKAPAPTAGATRLNHSFEFLPGATQMHAIGATEPHGFSKRVEYDSLLRTTKETDVLNLSSVTEWDPIQDLELSKTDPTGLKATTIYDDDDRPVENYGPVPAAWFGADRRPLAANASQVPKATTGYDEGITGLAAAYMASNAPQQANMLANNQSMVRNQSLWSLDRRFNFIYQGDGNIVLYGPSGVMWAANTGGVASDRLTMQTDGNLVLYNGGSAVWASHTGGGSSAHLLIQNDGNAVIYTSGGSTWATHSGGWPGAGPTNVSLTGAPLLNATNIATDGTISKNFGTAPPVPNHTGGWGMSLTGKMRLPTTGNWNFRIFSDNGVRVWIDDVQVQNDWYSEGQRWHPSFSFNNTVANSSHRVRIEYYHTSGEAKFMLYATPPGGSETANVAQYFNPGYSLKTSETAYDSQLGNTTTRLMYDQPEYSLVNKTVLDPGGLNLQTTSTYEAPGNGFLRQTSKTLPGGTTTAYQHYGASDTRDNPCTTETESYQQAGRPKGKVEADPDGAGPATGRSSEIIYNAAGETIAMRFNNDPWTCTEYDARGRVTRTIIPMVGTRPGRTIVNTYAVDGNPLVTATSDAGGAIRVENDLLGRTLKYTDALGKVTANTYDTYGKLTQRTSALGAESYEYDQYDRLTKHKLDSVTYATVSYDQFNRVSGVQYPAGISLSSITRDALGRENGDTFTLSNGQTLTDQIERYTSGDIKQGTENGTAKQYSYDAAGRLTGATIGTNTYTYEFGAPDASCSSLPGNNPNAGKNGNRTKLTVNGQITTFCYDQADRLTASSDPTLTNAQYDSRGNTTSLGDTTHKTELLYDASDRNIGIKAGNTESTFERDAQDRIISRTHKVGNQVTNAVAYGFTGSGDTPDYLLNGSGTVTQKYITLPGDVIATIKTNSTSAGATTYSLPNIHGDVFATVNADGALMDSFMSGPFGEVLPNQPAQLPGAIAPTDMPVNTATGTSFSYVGQHQKITDTDTSPISGGIIQMGARVYVPILGRFLQVDSVEGGTDNNYAYANDPVNEQDLDGKALPLLGIVIAAAVRAAAPHIARIAVQYVARPAAQFVATKAAPFLAKKAVTVARKIVPVVRAGASKAQQQLAKAKQWLANGTNYIRIGHGRVSVGPAPRHYGGPKPGSNIPFHIHLERAKAGINIYKPKPKCVKLWGRWRC